MNRYYRIPSIISGVVLSVALCAAQQNSAPADAPKADPQTQAAQPYGPLYQAPGNATDAQAQPVADTRPLSGILGLTLGSTTATLNLLSTSFSFGQIFDSNPGIQGSQSDYTAESALGGSLKLHRASGRRSLDLAYSGGSVIYIDDSFQTSFHNLNLIEMLNSGRWTVTVTDSLGYSSQGNLGAGLGLNNFGSGSLGLGRTDAPLMPNQSIYTNLSRQLSNTAGGQVEYGLSPRSSWTAGVTYGNLYYPDGAYNNNHQINVRTGYNRNWTAKDTISIFYGYGAFRSSANGALGNLDSHSIQLGYARRVTGRLTWSVAGGPQLSKFPVFGDTKVSWTASTRLQYRRQRTELNGSYDHGVTEALVGGTTTDTLQLGITRLLTQRWSVAANGGLYRNAQLTGTTEIRSGFAGAQVQRSLGERMSVYFDYAFQRQVSDGACAGTICTGLSRQVFGFGFSWAPRPWILR